MTARLLRRIVAIAAVAAASDARALVSRAQTPRSVYVAEMDGLIHPVSAEYMIQTMDRADAADAALTIFELRTPGGLLESTRRIITRMLAARTPVVVFVAPAGARAASAGFLLTIAADVAAMAPGTHIGAAHPVGATGAKLDDVMAKKATEDVAAYARTLAGRRHRNVDLAAQAVIESRAFTDEEASRASPPLVDLVAPDVPDLLRQLDGRSITRFDGSTVVVRTADAHVVQIGMNWRQRLLSAIAHPEVLYLLLSLGTLGLTIELWSPGAVLPGVIGGLGLLLALFGFQILPVNYAGVLLMLFGMALLVLEVKVTSYGVLTAGGLTSLFVGSMILMDTPAPELQVSRRLVVSTVLGIGAIAVFLTRLAVSAQRLRPVTGVAGMIGQVGRALTPIEPGRAGQVLAHGEIWKAVSGDAIAPGDAVIVTGVEGLTLTVGKA
jgi:membrane-bound serine protease (ClpP class)